MRSQGLQTLQDQLVSVDYRHAVLLESVAFAHEEDFDRGADFVTSGCKINSSLVRSGVLFCGFRLASLFIMILEFFLELSLYQE